MCCSVPDNRRGRDKGTPGTVAIARVTECGVKVVAGPVAVESKDPAGRDVGRAESDGTQTRPVGIVYNSNECGFGAVIGVPVSGTVVVWDL